MSAETQEFAFPALDGPLVFGTSSTAADRAAQIVADARAEAEGIIGEAERIGFERGFEAGREEARAALAPAAESFAAALAGLEDARGELELLNERRAVELGLAIADKALSAALAVDPTLVLSVVGGALRAASAGDGLAVEVNPDDYDLVRATLDERIEVVAERRVVRGGCVVRTSEGEIDGRVSEQLARAEEVLREVFTQRAAETAAADG